MTFASAELVNDMPRSRVRPDASIDGLPPRTLLIARMIAGGMNESEITHAFGRRRTTIERERKRFCAATGAVSRRDIVLACRRFGLEPV